MGAMWEAVYHTRGLEEREQHRAQPESQGGELSCIPGEREEPHPEPPPTAM